MKIYHFYEIFFVQTQILIIIFITILTINAKKKLKEQDIIQKVLKDYVIKYLFLINKTKLQDWRVRPRGANDSWPGKNIFIFNNNYIIFLYLLFLPYEKKI